MHKLFRGPRIRYNLIGDCSKRDQHNAPLTGEQARREIGCSRDGEGRAITPMSEPTTSLNRSSPKLACGRHCPVNLSVTFAVVPYLRINERRHMTDTVGIAGDRIRSFIERIEHIDEEIKALNEGKKEALSEAKGEGFDVKVLKEILRLRKQDKDERDEHESLLDLYLRAMAAAALSQAKAA